MDQNYSGLGRIDSINYCSLVSQSIKPNDYYALNMSFSMGRNNSRFYDLNRQPTNMSQVSVGGFKIRRDTSINENGDVFVSQFLGMKKQEDFDQELDDIMLNNSINVSGKQFANNMQITFSENEKNQNENNFYVPMTNSYEMDNIQKQIIKNSLMNKSAANKNNFDDINLDQSASVRYSVNLTKLQNDNMLIHSNSNFKSIMPISLIDKKLKTMSEPDLDLTYQDIFPQNKNDNKNKNNFSGNDEYDFNNDFNSNTSDMDLNSNSNNNKRKNNQNMKESIGAGLTIAPYIYNGTGIQDQKHSYSDDEQPNKKSPVKIKAIAKDSKKVQKGSQYRQSRHKNVFKNFGGTLVRFIIYNQYFQERVIEELQKDAEKKQKFYNWLQTDIKLERKKDFQIAWTTFKTDKEDIREYKCLLRELSRDFFENFSFIYLINSKKISDMEIHLRSIHTYLAAINNPDSLERFKPV